LLYFARFWLRVLCKTNFAANEDSKTLRQQLSDLSSFEVVTIAFAGKQMRMDMHR
jgi:hypothetical protein